MQIISDTPLDVDRHLVSQSDRVHLRSAGVHLSQIYYDIESTLTPREEMEQAQLEVYRSAGFLWEYVFSKAMAESLESDVYVRPGEVELDGIIGSPDLYNTREGRVADTKFMWKSARKLENLEKFFWTWLIQLKGYCKMMGIQDAELFVFACNGNYKPPVPVARHIVIHFSVHELEANWMMIKNHARSRGWKVK